MSLPPPLPPRPNIRPQGPPPPPGLPGFAPSIRPRVNSAQLLDNNPQEVDEDACRKQSTNYKAFTIRKSSQNNPKIKPTWAVAEVTEERFSQDEIAKQIKKLNKTRPSVAEKMTDLAPFQHKQVTKLLDDLITQQYDPNFQWSVVQLDRRERALKHGKRETTTVHVYLKRAPRVDQNPVVLLQHIERNKAARLGEEQRPPPQGEQQGGAAQTIDSMLAFEGYDYLSSSSHESDISTNAYDSDPGNSLSPRGYQKKHEQIKKEPRPDHSADHKDYLSERIRLPESLYRDSIRYDRAPQPCYAPDPVAEAYRAGRRAADAERLGLVDGYTLRHSVGISPMASTSPGYLEYRYWEPPYFEDRFGNGFRAGDCLESQREVEEHMKPRDGVPNSNLAPSLLPF